MSFGENLRFLRTEAGLTQEQFAEEMEVTRQSVSKWESDSGFPEMDKLIQISDRFDCNLDDLLRGSVQGQKQTDTIGYDAHMTRRARMIALGVMLCILAPAGAAVVPNRLGGIVFFALLIPGVLLLVLSGIWHHQFQEEHPVLIPFYKKEELSAARKRYPLWIVCGIGVILSALLVWNIGDIWDTVFIDGIGLGFIALGVGLLVYGGLEHEKYNIEKNQNEFSKVLGKEESKSDHWCGVIMMTATIIFLLYLFLGNGHSDVGRVAAAVYTTGGLLCGIIGILENKEKN